MNRIQRHRLVAVGLVVLAFVAWAKSFYVNVKYERKEAPEPTSINFILDSVEPVNFDFSSDEGGATEEIGVVETPAKLNIDMPFYSQAPFADWGMPYQEACEEASVLLVANLLQNKGWSVEDFDKEILKIVEWEMERFGAYEHTTVAQTAEMVEEYLGLNARVVENPSFEDLKRAIARGRLIVAPFAGKELGNPYFTNGGPVYHMFVVKGYDDGKKQVVVSEVGTRRGENYVYDWEIIQNALHDWHDEDIKLGRKRWIEVWGS